jgi:hypothetical protein
LLHIPVPAKREITLAASVCVLELQVRNRADFVHKLEALELLVCAQSQHGFEVGGFSARCKMHV